jgi:hypothetical protein
MRPRYVVAAYDYEAQRFVFVGHKGLTDRPGNAVVFRSGPRAAKAAARHAVPKSPLSDGLVFGVCFHPFECFAAPATRRQARRVLRAYREVDAADLPTDLLQLMADLVADEAADLHGEASLFTPEELASAWAELTAQQDWVEAELVSRGQ